MKRLCLNMIVKNESKNIERCLRAAAPHIDCYAICDTGSTDDTPQMIARIMAEYSVPGIIAHTTFRDFEQARNEGLEAARGSHLAFDYLLFCDADMELVVADRGFRERLTEPVYRVMQRHPGGGLEYANVRLVERGVNGKYRGLTHEYFDSGPINAVLLHGVSYLDYASGGTRDVKEEREIRLLEQGLRKEPDNARYAFYLANSYFECGRLDEALHWYRRRMELGGWQEELFYSGYRIALIFQRQGKEAEFEHDVLSLHEKYPHRAEPLHTLALHYQRTGRHRLAYMMAQAGVDLPKPVEALFVEAEVSEWRLKDIMGVSLYWLNRKAEALKINYELLDIVPESQRARIRANIEWCLKGSAAWTETKPAAPPPAPLPAPTEGRPTGVPRRLVVCTCGDREPAVKKAWHSDRKFDLAIINHAFKTRSFRDTAADFHFENVGHKWHNIKLFCEQENIVAGYDYVWFPDDDLDISHTDVERLFDIVHARNMRLCQPSLTWDSHISWDVVRHRPNSEVRRTNFVEIMCPIFRADALEICLPTFDAIYSGWGFDFVWPKMLENRGVGIVDAVQVRHIHPNASAGWKLPSGKTPRQEMDDLLQRHGILSTHPVDFN